MMNRYAANFVGTTKKFATVDFESVDQMLETVTKYFVERNYQLKQPDSTAPVAHIVLGFSGNGKTTFIRKHVQKGDQIISMDWVTREALARKTKPEIDWNYVIASFGGLIENAAQNGVDIWLDGLWLNISTRFTLITTLHEYGYQVTLYNLLSEGYVAKCQRARTIDECIRVYGENYTPEQLLKVQKYINDYLEKERKTRYVEEQKAGGYFNLLVESIIDIH